MDNSELMQEFGKKLEQNHTIATLLELVNESVLRNANNIQGTTSKLFKTAPKKLCKEVVKIQMEVNDMRDTAKILSRLIAELREETAKGVEKAPTETKTTLPDPDPYDEANSLSDLN